MTARLFGGAVDVYSTCRDCGEVMTVLSPYATVHPTCQAKPTAEERLATQWITALCNDEKSKAATLKRRIEDLAQQRDLDSAAVDYAEWGWPVFPLARCSKAPAISKAKGGKGFHDANCDAERIGKWWARHPDHNIGLATGKAFDVIDVDPRNGGVESFLKLLDTGDLPEIHGVAVTASGGMHLYVKPRNSKSFPALKPGIDYKARGGYVVGPPSTLGAPGRDYSWLTVPSPVLKGGAVQ